MVDYDRSYVKLTGDYVTEHNLTLLKTTFPSKLLFELVN